KKLARRRLRHAALAASDVFFDDVFERMGRDVGGLDQALFAARHIGDDHRSAASAAFSVQRFKNLELHDVVAPISVHPLPAGYAGRPPPQGGRCTESAAGALLRTSVPPTRLLHLLHIDADSAATGEPDLPGSLVGDAEFERLRLAALDYVERLGHHRTLDAAAGDAAEEIALIVDHQVR